MADSHGALIRGDVSRKNISIVFTGDEFADGGEVIRKALKENHTPASFFLTGNFYANSNFSKLIKSLKKEGHYLGAHSDKHLLYADWVKRDSLLISRDEFENDLRKNYERMARFGISKSDAPYFLPPYEWYNKTIKVWTDNLGFKLINFSPGTRSIADYTYPEMGASYRPSDEIYQSVLDKEKADPNGLNGFILLVHIGTDPRRTDKFYNLLDGLIKELKLKGYRFVPLKTLFLEKK
ncbi:polysaccharide deacetylase family protein [Daejeonella lutea]|uniref:polysaccharide deacetylase family protein n=1 Tax=Daejeonella lutea TaxID=572036 RepID=UPI0009A5C85B|nr:polysaccharide deacetylase family protein [Daejeonella lutea]